MTKYRKKPVVIEAVKFDGENFEECTHFLGNANCSIEIDKDEQGGIYGIRTLIIVIHTLEGDMKVNWGDYIIRGVNGEYYPCKPDIFEKTYEVVENE